MRKVAVFCRTLRYFVLAWGLIVTSGMMVLLLVVLPLRLLTVMKRKRFGIQICATDQYVVPHAHFGGSKKSLLYERYLQEISETKYGSRLYLQAEASYMPEEKRRLLNRYA